MEGIVSICDKNAKVLFDLGWTHSYVSPRFVMTMDVHADVLSFVLLVTTAEGK